MTVLTLTIALSWNAPVALAAEASPSPSATGVSEVPVNATGPTTGEPPQDPLSPEAPTSSESSSQASQPSSIEDPLAPQQPTLSAPRDAAVPRAAGNPLLCQADTLYSVSAGGAVRQISGSAVTTVGSWTGVSDVNGLAVGANGDVAYAYDRAGRVGQNVASILRYTPATKSWVSLPNTASTTNNSRSLIAGAVNLVTGHFLFGGYHDMGSRLVFRLYDFDPTTNATMFVGYIDTGLSSSTTTANGDMAFDSAGNLYVVRSGTSVNIYSVTAATLANALASPGNQINRSASASFTLTGFGTVNGLAFNGDGTVFLGSSDTVRKYDPTTWTYVSTSTTTLSSSTDLASCSSPANVTVLKNVVGRAASSDQFTMTLKNGPTTVATATTSGTSNGIQAQQIGPVPVPSGTALTMTETAASGSLSAYSTSWSCTNGASGMGSTLSVTSPGSGQSLSCTFTNSPLVGALRIAKVVSGGGVASTTPFVVSYNCGPDFTGAVDVTTAQPVTVAGIPNGRSCTVSEDTTQLTQSKLIDASYSWAAASSGVLSPAGAQTIVTDTTKSFTVTNTTTRKYGSITVTKALAGGVTAADLIGNATFTGAWSCQYPTGTVVAGGGWTVAGVGVATLTATTGSLATIPLTAACAVSENTPSNALFRDSSWSWASGVASPAQATVAAGAPAAFTVTNTAQRGSLTLVKNVDNTNGGGAVSSDWNQKLTAKRGTATYTFDTGEQKYLPAGEYSLEEINQIAGYQLTGIICGGDAAAVTKVVVPVTGNVTCTFTNVSRPGAVTWTKTDPEGASLGGSVWTLTGPGSTGPTVEVVDCVQAPCTGPDADPAVGTFSVVSLTWGTYTLVEKTAPIGYLIDPTSHGFTIDGTNAGTVVTIGAFVNTPVVPPTLPLTGGVGRDAYIFGGFAIMAIAAAIFGVRRLRRTRRL
ncbi:DUF5979 domain-containing protein [Microbacterium sp. MMO-56]|uniref:DUF5979 domain-containing protein n=1 Tax=Microbacterium sp. MMO-56 TaxID=3081281 RepID=UPI0030178F8C